jgi:hypothetical protein
MTNDLQPRIDALKEKGWQFIEAPSWDEEHAKTRRSAPFQAERFFRGSPIREHAQSMEKLLEMVGWQQARLEGLEETPVAVVEGVVSTGDNPSIRKR